MLFMSNHDQGTSSGSQSWWWGRGGWRPHPADLFGCCARRSDGAEDRLQTGFASRSVPSSWMLPQPWHQAEEDSPREVFKPSSRRGWKHRRYWGRLPRLSTRKCHACMVFHACEVDMGQFRCGWPWDKTGATKDCSTSNLRSLGVAKSSMLSSPADIEGFCMILVELEQNSFGLDFFAEKEQRHWLMMIDEVCVVCTVRPKCRLVSEGDLSKILPLLSTQLKIHSPYLAFYVLMLILWITSSLPQEDFLFWKSFENANYWHA